MEPLLSNGYCRAAYFTIIAQQPVYMPQHGFGLNVHAQTKDKSGDRRNTFCEELESCIRSYVDGRIILKLI
jgi:hypothetical protein